MGPFVLKVLNQLNRTRLGSWGVAMTLLLSEAKKGLGFWGLRGLGVRGLGFRGLGFRVWGLGFSATASVEKQTRAETQKTQARNLTNPPQPAASLRTL